MKFMMFKVCAFIAFVLNLQATSGDGICDKFSELSLEQLRSLTPSTIDIWAANCGAKFCGTFYRLSDEQLRSLTLFTIESLSANCGDKFCAKLSELSSDQLRSLTSSTIESLSANCGAKFCKQLPKLSFKQLASVTPSTIKSLAATCGDDFCDRFSDLSDDQLRSVPLSTIQSLAATCQVDCDKLNQLNYAQLESLTPSGLGFFQFYLAADGTSAEVKAAAEGFLGQIQAEKIASNASAYTGSRPFELDLLLGICKIARNEMEEFNLENVQCNKMLRLKDEEAKNLWVQFVENPKYFLRKIHKYPESNLLKDPCGQEKFSQHNLEELCELLKNEVLNH